MYRSYAPTTEDIDNFRFDASRRLVDLLRGEVDLDSILAADGNHAELDDDFPLAA